MAWTTCTRSTPLNIKTKRLGQRRRDISILVIQIKIAIATLNGGNSHFGNTNLAAIIVSYAQNEKIIKFLFSPRKIQGTEDI